VIAAEGRAVLAVLSPDPEALRERERTDPPVLDRVGVRDAAVEQPERTRRIGLFVRQTERVGRLAVSRRAAAPGRGFRRPFSASSDPPAALPIDVSATERM
jgi:hypothetical protein